jgi:hypothetical protein
MFVPISATMTWAVFCDNDLGGGLREAGDPVEQGDDLSLIGVLSTGGLNLRGKAGNGLVKAVDLSQQLGQHKTLVRLEMVE